MEAIPLMTAFGLNGKAEFYEDRLVLENVRYGILGTRKKIVTIPFSAIALIELKTPEDSSAGHLKIYALGRFGLYSSTILRGTALREYSVLYEVDQALTFKALRDRFEHQVFT